MPVELLTEQERATSTSLQAAWVLAKHNKPFTDAEVSKVRMVAVLEELATDKPMDMIIASVRQISLSAKTVVLP